MIRINLLGRPRPRVKRRVAIAGTLQLILFLIPVGAAILGLILHWYIIRSDMADLQEQITEEQRKKSQMAKLEAEIQQFEEAQRLLEQQKQTIQELQEKQAGPVRLLEAVGDTVSRTATLWLTSMQEQATGEIEFKGMAGSMDAVADFLTNLDRSGYFESIEMKESVQRPQGEGAARFEFTVSVRFSLPAPPQETPAAAPAAAGGGRT